MTKPPLTLSDGRPLDDAQPQDTAREFSIVLEKFADLIMHGGPDDANREETEIELRRCAALLKVWANFGRWYSKDDLRNVARHALWLNATDRVRPLISYDVADQAVREYLKNGLPESRRLP